MTETPEEIFAEEHTKFCNVHKAEIECLKSQIASLYKENIEEKVLNELEIYNQNIKRGLEYNLIISEIVGLNKKS